MIYVLLLLFVGFVVGVFESVGVGVVVMLGVGVGVGVVVVGVYVVEGLVLLLV